MGDLFDKLSELAQKIEKKAPLKLTEEEKKIAEEIESQREGARARAPAARSRRAELLLPMRVGVSVGGCLCTAMTPACGVPQSSSDCRRR